MVVPTALNLQQQGYGVESGLPTLIVGAASLDVVITISLFGIFLGLAFSDGEASPQLGCWFRAGSVCVGIVGLLASLRGGQLN